MHLLFFDNPFNPVFVVWWKQTCTAECYNVNMIPDEPSRSLNVSILSKLGTQARTKNWTEI